MMERWRLNHKDKITEYDKQWYQDHKEEKKEYGKKYGKNYRQTPEGKFCHQRSEFKRRYLGFIPLNKPFVDYEAHHISENFIIYIPYELHHSISHSIWTWQNMDAINKLAIEFV